MARQYRAGHQPVGSNSTTATCTVPGTVQVGDLMLLWWVTAATATATPATAAPAGWTYLGTTDTSGGSANFAVFLYAKTAVSGDIGAVITFTAGGATRQLAGVGAWYDDTAVPLAVEAVTFAQTTTLGTRTTVAENCHGIAGAASRRSTGIDTWTPATGYTERLDAATDASTGGKSSTTTDKLATVAAGTNLGGVSFTPSSGDGVEHSWVAAIKPNPTNPGAFLALL